MVKHGDKLPITFTVNHDLTGATTRLIVRHLTRGGILEELDHTVTGPSTITHTLDGTWAVGRHYLELEIQQAGETRTAPTDGFFTLRVDPDLDD